MENYSLDVVSLHPEFQHKKFKKYDLEGIDTIGVFDSENFAVVFKNNTNQRLQVKLTLDGTSILNGKPGCLDADTTDDVFSVSPYGTLYLKA